MASGKMRRLRSAIAVLAFALGVAAFSGCREQGDVPAYNRNLGSAQAPLLPPASTPLDPNVLQGPKVQAVELPAFDRDMPTLAEIERASKSASQPSTPDKETLQVDEAAASGDASLSPDEQ